LLNAAEINHAPSLRNAFLMALCVPQTYLGGEVVNITPPEAEHDYELRVDGPNSAYVLRRSRQLTMTIGATGLTDSSGFWPDYFPIGECAETSMVRIAQEDPATGLYRVPEMIVYDARALTLEACEALA
jgi:hypothetical protein